MEQTSRPHSQRSRHLQTSTASPPRGGFRICSRRQSVSTLTFGTLEIEAVMADVADFENADIVSARA
jgi:hypothetical protein